jgi:hypothetical protein
VADLSSVRGSGTEIGPSGVGAGSSWRAWVGDRSVFGYADSDRKAQDFADRALAALRDGRSAESVREELRSTESTQEVMSRLDRSINGAAGWASDAG